MNFANITILLLFCGMTGFLRHISCIALLCTYILSYMGIGIHNCSEEGVSHLVLLAGDISCESVHHHHHEDEHHHHAGCCTTEILVITDAQDSDTGSQTHIVPVLSAALSQPLAAAPAAASCRSAAPSLFTGIPPGIPRALISVWRL